MSDTLHEQDRLIGRIAANDADSIEWIRFEAGAKETPQSWERLARTLRDELQMRGALDDALAAADDVEIPDEAFDAPVAVLSGPGLARWSGWAMAAVLALAWVGASVFMPGPQPQVPVTHVDARMTPQSALDDYLRLGKQHGRVLDELPMVMMDARPIEGADGSRSGYEVYYVRQLLERTLVQDAFQINRDDLGRQVPVKVDFASFQSGSDL